MKFILLIIALGLIGVVLYLGYQLDKKDEQNKRKEKYSKKDKTKSKKENEEIKLEDDFIEEDDSWEVIDRNYLSQEESEEEEDEDFEEPIIPRYDTKSSQDTVVIEKEIKTSHNDDMESTTVVPVEELEERIAKNKEFESNQILDRFKSILYTEETIEDDEDEDLLELQKVISEANIGSKKFTKNKNKIDSENKTKEVAKEEKSSAVKRFTRKKEKEEIKEEPEKAVKRFTRKKIKEEKEEPKKNKKVESKPKAKAKPKAKTKTKAKAKAKPKAKTAAKKAKKTPKKATGLKKAKK